MRYPASEKLEIIRTVEGSHLPTKKTLDMLGIPRTTFYRWYDRYAEGGLDANRPGTDVCRLGCDRGQGFFFSRPLRVEKLEKLIETGALWLTETRVH